MRIGAYVLKQHVSGRKRYPLVLMLEPLFRCNLACAGCGKIDYPDEILNQRLSVDDCMKAMDECGAPVVSIAGGEPLLHREMPEIVRGYLAREGRPLAQCAAAGSEIDQYRPHKDFNCSIRPDGDKDMRQVSVQEASTKAVDASHGESRLPRQHQLHPVQYRRTGACFFDDRRLGPSMASPRAGLPMSARRTGSTSSIMRRPESLSGFSRGRAARAPLQPVGHVPRFSCRQSGLTPCGQSERTVFGWQRPATPRQRYAETFRS
jgi:hypothetical protein